jgi:Peptidase family M1 domain
MPSFQRCLQLAAGLFLLAVPFAAGQNPPPAGPNADPVYQQLRNITLSGDAYTVENIELKRDAATFHLHSGTICFVPPVQGKVTGAVFVGEGSMSLEAPSPAERRSLKLLTKTDEFAEIFNHLVLRFTDSTFQDITKDASKSQGPCDAGLLKDSQNVTRHKLHTNLEARILEDVLRPEPTGMFVAFVHGKHYDDKLLYVVDPNGAPDVAPEEVELMTYGEEKSGVWTAFRLSKEYRAKMGSASERTSAIHIDHQELDTTIEGSGKMDSKAKTTLVPRINGSRAVPFNLFQTLRVDSVVGQDGKPLEFIQENKNDDPDFWVIFPQALPLGENYTITTTYSGKEAVINEGNGNYFPNPGARENWYPANAGTGLGDFANFDMTFRIPKGMKMAASGSLISEKDEAGKSVSVWKSDIAQPLAGFQFGRMKVIEAKMTSPDFLVAAYANDEPPDWAKQYQGGTMGNLSTTSLMKNPLSEAQYAIRLYTDYFGPLPFKRLSMTQQTNCFFGQSWPDLVWLPICAFYDTTVRHQFGLDAIDNGYWDVVTPHEVAHQWWGQLVGFRSYRDQWMSEGFANFSASLFLQNAYGDKSRKMYEKFWDDQHKRLIEKDKEGFRPIDVGPVTMGARLDNTKSGGGVYGSLVYSKGAYILQMIRMMMWNTQTGDKNFKETMQDFTKTYGGRSATTEDFKTTIEKHMTPDLNAGGNGKMDWFFDEYVYGTALPTYGFLGTFEKNAQGEVVFNYKLTQSAVDDNYVMSVPVYIELADGKTIHLGEMHVKGNNTIEGKVALKGVKDTPKRAMINYNHDVLASN